MASRSSSDITSDVRLFPNQYRVLPSKVSPNKPAKSKIKESKRTDEKPRTTSLWPENQVERVVQYYLRTSESDVTHNTPIYCPCCEERNTENAARGTRRDVPNVEFDPSVEYNIGMYRPATTVLETSPEPLRNSYATVHRYDALHDRAYKDSFNPQLVGEPPELNFATKAESVYAAAARYRLAMDKLGKSVDKLKT